jgi:hypothetical protein
MMVMRMGRLEALMRIQRFGSSSARAYPVPCPLGASKPRSAACLPFVSACCSRFMREKHAPVNHSVQAQEPHAEAAKDATKLNLEIKNSGSWFLGPRVPDSLSSKSEGRGANITAPPYIREGQGENSVGGKGFTGNTLRRSLTPQRQEKWAVWQQNILLDCCNPLETNITFFRARLRL